jgi:hypothetical protein
MHRIFAWVLQFAHVDDVVFGMIDCWEGLIDFSTMEASLLSEMLRLRKSSAGGCKNQRVVMVAEAQAEEGDPTIEEKEESGDNITRDANKKQDCVDNDRCEFIFLAASCYTVVFSNSKKHICRT